MNNSPMSSVERTSVVARLPPELDSRSSGSGRSSGWFPRGVGSSWASRVGSPACCQSHRWTSPRTSPSYTHHVHHITHLPTPGFTLHPGCTRLQANIIPKPYLLGDHAQHRV